MELIDKEKLVTEIKRRIKKYATIDVGNSSELDALYGAKCKALMDILSFLDTLEVKEVELEKELKILDNTLFDLDGVAVKGATCYLTVEDVKDVAKYFFELGLKTKKGE